MSNKGGSSIRKKIVHGYMRIYCFISFMLLIVFLIASYLLAFYIIQEYVNRDLEDVIAAVSELESAEEMHDKAQSILPEYILRYDFKKKTRRIKEEDYYSLSYYNDIITVDSDREGIVIALYEDAIPEPSVIKDEEYLKTTEKVTPDIQKGYVTASSVYIRSEPEIDASIIYKAYYGTEVSILEDLGDWYKILYDNKELYCNAKLVSTGPMPTTTPAPEDEFWDYETTHLFSKKGVEHTTETSYDEKQYYNPIASLKEPYYLYTMSSSAKYYETENSDYIVEERYIIEAVADVRKIIPYDVIWAYFGIAFATMILMFFMGLLLVWIYGASKTKRYLKPINDITNLAGQIQPNSQYRLNVDTAKFELKELVLTINNMLDRLNAAHIKRKKFVSDVSHELRTPISVVAGYANMLKRWAKEDEAVFDESVEAIIEEASNMKYLVENLLFLARSDNDQNVYEKEQLDLSTLVDSIYKDAKMVDEGKHEILSEISEGIFVLGDRNRLKQAIREFIKNAVKYTPPSGYVKISLKKQDKKAIINITDTGMGISKKDMGHIFSRFYRGDASRNRDEGGYGLGLSICREIISAHDGKIIFKSKENAGTSVSIELKAK